MSFKLGTTNDRAILINEDNYYDLEQISNGSVSSDSVQALSSIDELNALSAKLQDTTPTGKLSEIELGNPVPNSRNSYAVGLNYKGHAEEGGMEIPEVPMVFTKHTSCFVGPKANVEMRSDFVDYEAELVVVIGKEGKDIKKENGWEHVAGMCIGQDISDRPAQFATQPPMFNLGKSFDTYGPMGPYLVSPDSLDNCESLDLECKLNGKTMQKDNTNDLIFDVPTIISYLSEIVTLKVGDTIWTGTPSGVGATQGIFLKDGDILTTSIEGLGEMENKCVRISNHSRADFLPDMFKGFLPKKED
jgi:2-keto-4-pentenoate hydratase/2-oxohepta-3-ene-1,7-dioic acid hydratase in catechol pathway